jgi:hypothetical protein
MAKSIWRIIHGPDQRERYSLVVISGITLAFRRSSSLLEKIHSPPASYTLAQASMMRAMILLACSWQRQWEAT